MKFDVEDSLRATHYGLIAIWVCGGVGLLLFTGKALFAILYLIILGPVLTLIYHAAKTELMGTGYGASAEKKKKENESSDAK